MSKYWDVGVVEYSIGVLLIIINYLSNRIGSNRVGE